MHLETSDTQAGEVILRSAGPRLINVQAFPDGRGMLNVAQHPGLPFACHRIYWISSPTPGAERGNHGHRELEQAVFAIQGSVEVYVRPLLAGDWSALTIRLESGGQGLYIPPSSWRSLRDFSSDAIVLVLASSPYDPSDYVFQDELTSTCERARQP